MNSSRGRPGSVPGSVDDEVARLRRQGDLPVGFIEMDRATRHADINQGRSDGGTDGLLLSGDALHRQEMKQAPDGLCLVKPQILIRHGPSSSEG